METFIQQSHPVIIPQISPYRTVILANGDFPRHPVPLSFLCGASHIICCDGAAEALLAYGLEPHRIVGDLDSLPVALQQRYRHCLHRDPDQNTNDLTKAVRFCTAGKQTEITILGATGKREDHTVGNISLMADYAQYAKIQMITDYGVFVPILRSARFESVAGQQVSIFSLVPNAVFTFRGLRYSIEKQTISSLWQGTLNEACGNEFVINMNNGKAVVFREMLGNV